MRRFRCLALLCVLTLTPALAMEWTTETLTGANGEIVVPRLDDEAADARVGEALEIEAARALLAGGALMTGDTRAYPLTLPSGAPGVSLCFTVSGNIRFGRYAQETRTLLLNLDTGEAVAPETLLGGSEALQEFVDGYADALWEDMNSYLDLSELSPVPLDAVCLDEMGVTFHYPGERFRYFSGNSGALSLRYYELEALLAPGLYASPGRETVFAVAAAGALPGLEGLRVGDSLAEALARYGAMGESDYVLDGEIYGFENAALRGVSALCARGGGEIEAVRDGRFDLNGLRPGVTREEGREALGEPESSGTLDEAAAAGERLRAGAVDRYAAGDYLLSVFYEGGETFTAYAVQVSRRER